MPEFGKKLGQILLEQGKISAPKLRLALHQQSLHPCPLGELLVSEKTVSHYNIAKALAQQQGLNHAETPDKPSVFPKSAAGFWLKTGLVPWRFTNSHWQIACTNVQDFYKILETCTNYAVILVLFLPSLHKFEAKRFSFFPRNCLSRQKQVCPAIKAADHSI